jgi:hypothetical protein
MCKIVSDVQEEVVEDVTAQLSHLKTEKPEDPENPKWQNREMESVVAMKDFGFEEGKLNNIFQDLILFIF